MKICKTCDKTKELTEYHTAGSYKGKPQYRGSCKECTRVELKSDSAKSRQKKHRSSDKYKKNRKEYRKLDHVKQKEKEYEELRKPIRISQRRVIHIERYANDILYKLKILCRQRTKEMLLAKRWVKTNKFKEYISCSIEELKVHIESQFKDKMTWGNHGEWEIDHIIPLSSAQTVEEMYKLCHYTNLQPLWWKDNLKKSDKMPGEY